MAHPDPTPSELNQYILKLLRLLREQTELVQVLLTLARESKLEVTLQKRQTIQAAVEPLLRQAFQQAQDELAAGNDPLSVLKQLLGAPDPPNFGDLP